ncbi:MAG: hypothetical protein D6735_09000 [Acidobacteria bacterium]|nr:MAG: hypothetical protein D6735_09000 [Acidobacteriota bacterium]
MQEMNNFVYDLSERLIAECSAQVANTTGAKVAYLTNDHLGSPRINTDANGNVTARHDYHPFGEEIGTLAAVPGSPQPRTAALGYQSDSVRQKFTGYERDSETDLDFAQARYYSFRHGRFMGVDAGPFMPADPQNFNRYVYVQNNPIKFTDSTGRKIELSGSNAQDFLNYLEKNSGLKFKTKIKNGVIIITGASKDKNFTGKVNKEFANVVKDVANASETAKFNVTTNAQNSSGEVVFFDDQENASQSAKIDFSTGKKTIRPGNVNMTSINSIAGQDADFAQALVGHFLIEGLEITKTGVSYVGDEQNPGAHQIGLEVERKILSEALGKRQDIRYDPPSQNSQIRTGEVIFFVYTDVQFDVIIQNDGSAFVKRISPPTVKRPKK